MEVGCAAALSHVCLSISSFLFWCFSDAFLMRFWCFSDAFLMNLMKQDSWAHGHGLVQSSNRPNEEEAEANRSQSKKRPKPIEANRRRGRRGVCAVLHSRKNWLPILQWYVKSICEIAARAPPAMHGLAKKEGRSHPLFCNRFIIYIICKSGGYIIAPKSHLTAKTEGRSGVT